MLSRVANSIYWMARYVERAENVARFIDVNLRLMLDIPMESAGHWQPLVVATGDEARFTERFGAATQDSVIRFLTFDADNQNSILSCLRAARENARSIREIISSEMWEQVNTFYLMVNDAASRASVVESPHEFFAAAKNASHLFEGITNATMSHGEAWHFCTLGRMMERGDKTSRMLDVKYYILLPTVADVGSPFDDIQWSAVLRSASAFEMYRKRHGRIDPLSIVEFLVLDREFPRAVHHCIIQASNSLHAISGTPQGTFRNAAEQRLGQLRSELAYTQVAEIIHGGLHEFLDALQTQLNSVDDAIFDTFFAPRPIPSQVAHRGSKQ